MAHASDKETKHAIAWLQQFSDELEADIESRHEKSVEEIRAELQDQGADVQGFHAKLAATLRRAKLQHAADALIAWVSPCWKPQWAGQWVGAGDVLSQAHTFPLEDGHIDVSCTWRPQSGNNPAYLDFAWNADVMLQGEFWCRFIRPETHEVLNELPLGSSREGGQYFTRQDLGFDPARERWAIVILIKQQDSRG
jgi:hypothetical protein